MKLTGLIAHLAAIPICFLATDPLHSQTGEFQKIHIHGFSPSLEFQPTIGNDSRFTKFQDKLGYFSSNGTPNITFEDAAPKAAFSVTERGFGIGSYDPSTPLHIYSNDDPAIGYDVARILVENDKSAHGTRPMLDLKNHGPVSVRMFYDQSRRWSFLAGGNNGQFQLQSTGVPSLVVNDHVDLAQAGFVGIGTLNPSSKLHVFSSNVFHDAKLVVENVLPDTRLRTMFELINNGPSRFEFHNSDSDETWSFQTNASDNFMINRLGSGGNEFSIRKNGMVTMGPGGKINFRLQPNGNLRIAGTISEQSDRNAKQAFQEIDRQSVLDKVCELPITTWRYKDEPVHVRHMGPMAQDFQAAFGLGDSATAISSVDRSGVALVAIQALNDKLVKELQDKEDRIVELENQLAEVITLVQQNQ